MKFEIFPDASNEQMYTVFIPLWNEIIRMAVRVLVNHPAQALLAVEVIQEKILTIVPGATDGMVVAFCPDSLLFGDLNDLPRYFTIGNCHEMVVVYVRHDGETIHVQAVFPKWREEA